MWTGRPNVEALGRSLTAKQLMGWERYAALEPFDETRADWRAAQIAQMIFNMAVAQKDRKKIEDFRLKFGEEAREPDAAPRRQSIDEQLLFFKVLAMTGGAKAAD